MLWSSGTMRCATDGSCCPLPCRTAGRAPTARCVMWPIRCGSWEARPLPLPLPRPRLQRQQRMGRRASMRWPVSSPISGCPMTSSPLMNQPTPPLPPLHRFHRSCPTLISPLPPLPPSPLFPCPLPIPLLRRVLCLRRGVSILARPPSPLSTKCSPSSKVVWLSFSFSQCHLSVCLLVGPPRLPVFTHTPVLYLSYTITVYAASFRFTFCLPPIGYDLSKSLP